jgi:hypothetical protein
VFGVEVTVPALATRCNLGNLDPQHSEGRNVAACVAALDCELPPDGATLVTVRADADSVAAMAILDGRLRGQDAYLRPEIVDAIGRGDSAPDGPWIRDYRPSREFTAANRVAMNHREPIRSRVAEMAGLLSGAIKISVPTEDYSTVDVKVSRDGRYAVARADGPAGRGACAAGYRHAPVVVAVNRAFSLRGEEPHRKYTIARWNATHVPMDWDGMLAELRALEPGWGGSSSICGSPQGVASMLTMGQVTEIVDRYLA